LILGLEEFIKSLTRNTFRGSVEEGREPGTQGP
jgi:hypothetical protein